MAWLGWHDALRVNLVSLLAVGAVALLANLGARYWSPFIVGALLLSPLAWYFGVALPAAQRAIGVLPAASVLRLDAVVRDRWDLRDQSPRVVRVLFGDARVVTDAGTYSLAEIEVELPAKSAWVFRSGRPMRIAGTLVDARSVGHRLRIRLGAVDFTFNDRPIWATGETWRIRLQDRANYYLGKRASAVFLPMVLDVRDRRAVESRDIVAEFRRVGISHLFAISGMNIALIFGLLMVTLRVALSHAQPGQGWVHARDAARGTSVALIWLYIGLIGFPTPAVRAAIMGSVLIALDSRGARTPSLYVLLVTGLAMLAWSPSQLYDISFQLSFLAYGFLVAALRMGGMGPARDGYTRLGWMARRGAWLLAMNLGVTAIVTLGLWPLITAKFGTFSWLVFAGNLLLVPVMGAVLLPLAMLTLVVAAANLGSAPGTLLERGVFDVLEAALTVWLRLLRGLDRWAGNGLLEVPADWSAREVILYYVTLIALLTTVIRLHPRRENQPASGADSTLNLH